MKGPNEPTKNMNVCSACGAKGGKCVVGWIVWVLVIVGGLNWGLIGVLNFNLVDAIFGEGSVVSTVVYILVGIAAVVSIFGCRCMKCCPNDATVVPPKPMQ
jgi:uncharacterized protein